MGLRRWVAVIGSGIAAVVALASAAWACTAWTAMSPLSEPAGTPGTTVKVAATTSSGPVEIRWDGLQGPLLATMDIQNGSFTKDVKIPDAPPGIHYVVVSSLGNGQWSRAAFKIPGKASAISASSAVRAPATSQPWSEVVEATHHGPAAGFATGMVLLAGGSVALLAGFAALAVRRTRVGSPTHRSSTD